MQKDAGLKLVLFTRTRRIQGRQTMRAPVPSPCKILLNGSKVFVHPTLVRYRIRISIWVSSQFLFLCEPLFLQTCSLDALHLAGLAAHGACCWS